MFGTRRRRKTLQQPMTTYDRHKLGWRELELIQLRNSLPTAREAVREFAGFVIAGAAVSAVFVAGCVAVFG